MSAKRKWYEVPLGTKNLRRVYDWAEREDNNHPLAESYLMLCGGCAGVDTEKLVYLPMFLSAKIKWQDYGSPIYDAYHQTLNARDIMGRLILRYILDKKPE